MHCKESTQHHHYNTYILYYTFDIILHSNTSMYQHVQAPHQSAICTHTHIIRRTEEDQEPCTAAVNVVVETASIIYSIYNMYSIRSGRRAMPGKIPTYTIASYVVHNSISCVMRIHTVDVQLFVYNYIIIYTRVIICIIYL